MFDVVWKSGMMYSTSSAAKLLGVSTRTVQRWIESGMIQTVQAGTHRKIPVGELARLLGVTPETLLKLEQEQKRENNED